MDRAPLRRGVEIDFIDEHAGAELADRAELGLPGERAARVVQVGEDDQPRAVGHGAAHDVGIEAKALVGPALEALDLRAEEARRAEQGIVGRTFDQHLVAR